MVVTDADAKRLGGSKSTGMQRDTPSQPVQKAPPQQPDATPAAGAVPGAAAAAPAAAAAAKAAPAAAAKRSWTGPLMGLAAGLGLAALFSALGMGEAFSSFMMILLLALVGFMLLRFVASRFGGRGRVGAGGLATAGAAAGSGSAATGLTAAGAERRSVEPVGVSSSATAPSTSGITIGSALAQPATAANARYLPADFDSQAFERAAKTIFIRLQAANDDRNLDDLRAFSTPEMFAELKADLLERGERRQHTDVISVNPTIVDFSDEGRQRVVSVRYVGVIREDANANAESFDEIWHLVQTGDSPAWRIAGIQQAA
jgi:predicted lipid-binding transport protein (Tim44 family)